jgi:hypothetical protein
MIEPLVSVMMPTYHSAYCSAYCVVGTAGGVLEQPYGHVEVIVVAESRCPTRCAWGRRRRSPSA